jgi:hypothetical protein
LRIPAYIGMAVAVVMCLANISTSKGTVWLLVALVWLVLLRLEER